MAAGPPAIQARVTGDENLVRTLRAAAADVADLSDVNRQAAELVAESGRGRAPVDTGALRDSITVEVTREVGRAAAATEYAGVQEWGWRAHNIPAQPFLAPALLDNQGRIEDLYAKALETAIGKVKGA